MYTDHKNKLYLYIVEIGIVECQNQKLVYCQVGIHIQMVLVVWCKNKINVQGGRGQRQFTTKEASIYTTQI